MFRISLITLLFSCISIWAHAQLSSKQRNELALFGDVNPTRISDYQSLKNSSVLGGGIHFKHFFTAQKGIRGGLFLLSENIFVDKDILLSKGDSVFKSFWEKDTRNFSGFIGAEIQRTFFKTLVFYGFGDLCVGVTRGKRGDGTVYYIYGTDKQIGDYLDGQVTFEDVKAITTQIKPGIGAKLNLKGIVVGAEASLSLRVNFPQGVGQLTVDSRTFLNRLYVGFRF